MKMNPPDTSQAREESESATFPLHLLPQEDRPAIPTPLVRITTCGGLKLHVLQEVILPDVSDASDASDSAETTATPQGRYRTILPHQCPKGSTTALTLLKILVSLPQHYAARDWLAEHLPRLRRDKYATEDEEEGWERRLVRMDNVVSILRNLLCPSDLAGQEGLRKRVISYVKNHRDSGPGYRLAGAPLVWLDVDLLVALVIEAALREQRPARCNPLSPNSKTGFLASKRRKRCSMASPTRSGRGFCFCPLRAPSPRSFARSYGRIAACLILSSVPVRF
ncbi:MAG: hypothetical protein IMW89_15465 [Ktedonobacteraceae bacterium]|nr:hypothetical protein [Ktedonobacteraceae bacterium]